MTLILKILTIMISLSAGIIPADNLCMSCHDGTAVNSQQCICIDSDSMVKSSSSWKVARQDRTQDRNLRNDRISQALDISIPMLACLSKSVAKDIKSPTSERGHNVMNCTLLI